MYRLAKYIHRARTCEKIYFFQTEKNYNADKMTRTTKLSLIRCYNKRTMWVNNKNKNGHEPLGAQLITVLTYLKVKMKLKHILSKTYDIIYNYVRIFVSCSFLKPRA